MDKGEKAAHEIAQGERPARGWVGDGEARLEEIRDMRSRAYAVWREGSNSWDATQHIEWLLSEIDRLHEIEEAASDAWREYDRKMGLSEDVDAATDYREVGTDDVDDAMWRLKAKLEGEDD